MSEEKTCVVVGIRDHREFVRLQTSQGEVDVEVRAVGAKRCRVCVRAPREVRVHRVQRETEAADER